MHRQTILIAGAFVLGALCSAPAGAVPKLPLEPNGASLAVQVAEKVPVWRPYYRLHGKTYWRRYYQEPRPPVPVRPLSCGEFRFWDGHQCVDVRQTAPAARAVRGRARVR